MPLSRYIRYLSAVAVAFAFTAVPATAAALQDKATWPDGRQRQGILQLAPSGNVVFGGARSEPAVPLERLRQIEFALPPADPEPAPPPYRVRLWNGDVVVARAVFIQQSSAKLLLHSRQQVTVDRGALAAIEARGAAEESLAPLRLGTQHDQVIRSDGDQIIGIIEAGNEQQFAIRGAFGLVRMPSNRLHGILLRRTTPVGRTIEGVRVQIRLRNGEQAADDDVLQGTLVNADGNLLELDHPLLGRLHLNRARARSLQILGSGRYVPIDSAAYHLGNDVRLDFELPQPEGNELQRAFTLDQLPRGSAYFVCEGRHLEGMDKDGQFAAELRDGHLRTQLWINGRLVDHFNQHVWPPSEQQQRFRIALPPGLLKQGHNTMRITQTPLPYNKADYDDIVLSSLAIEIADSQQ